MTGVLELAKRYLERRYRSTANERLAARGAEMESPPHFVLVRTELGCLWRFREDLAPGPLRALSKLAGREGPLSGSMLDAPWPERAEPMLRGLRGAGIEVAMARECVVRRAGWEPSSQSSMDALFRIDEDCASDSQAQALRTARWGSICWSRRRELDSCQWIVFADLVRFVDLLRAPPRA